MLENSNFITIFWAFSEDNWFIFWFVLMIFNDWVLSKNFFFQLRKSILGLKIFFKIGGGEICWIKFIFSWNTYRNIYTLGIFTGICTPGIPSGLYIYSWDTERNLYTPEIPYTGIHVLLEYLQKYKLLEYIQEYIYSWNT